MLMYICAGPVLESLGGLYVCQALSYHYTLRVSRQVNFCKFSREAREACLHLKRVELLKSLVRAARARIYAHTNNDMHTCTRLVYNYQIQGKHGLTH